MAQLRVQCQRCGRTRVERYMVQGGCIHGVYWTCAARTSCKVEARRRRKT